MYNYSNCKDPSFTVDQQYTDDIGRASTTQHVPNNVEKKTTTEKLRQGNILINQSKTEKYHIKKGGDKRCKSVNM